MKELTFKTIIHWNDGDDQEMTFSAYDQVDAENWLKSYVGALGVFDIPYVTDIHTFTPPFIGEHELNFINEFGYEVTVHYKNSTVITHHNCTELHFNCNPGRVAIESDVHDIGGTRAMNEIKKIEIEPATEKYNCW